MNLLVTEELNIRTHLGDDPIKQFRIVSNSEVELDFIQYPLYTLMRFPTLTPDHKGVKYYGHLTVKTQEGAVLQEFKPKYAGSIGNSSLKFESLDLGNVRFQLKEEILRMEVTNHLGQIYTYVVACDPGDILFMEKSENGFLKAVKAAEWDRRDSILRGIPAARLDYGNLTTMKEVIQLQYEKDAEFYDHFCLGLPLEIEGHYLTEDHWFRLRQVGYGNGSNEYIEKIDEIRGLFYQEF